MDMTWMGAAAVQALVVAFGLLFILAGTAGLGTLANRRGWRLVETVCAKLGIALMACMAIALLVAVGLFILLGFGALVALFASIT